MLFNVECHKCTNKSLKSVCKILTGGGKSLFLEINKDELRSEELTKVAEDALD